MADVDKLFETLAALSPDEAQTLSDKLRAKLPKSEPKPEKTEAAPEAEAPSEA
jgi:hypothetical protein